MLARGYLVKELGCTEIPAAHSGKNDSDEELKAMQMAAYQLGPDVAAAFHGLSSDCK